MIKKVIGKKFSVYNFYYDFIVENKLYNFINTVINENTKLELKKRTPAKKASIHLNNTISYITYIPYYLDITTATSLKKSGFNRLNGYAIDIKNFDSLEQYIKHQFSSKNRTRIRSNIKRLETCFNISYRTFYGSISKQEYNDLMDNLKKLTDRRFKQRGDKHSGFNNWEYLKEITYNRILNKEASLFVIYNEKEAIDICLSFHFKNILVNYFRSYNIDYSRFRMGYIDIAKQLEWCIANNFEIFDLGHGNFRYKDEWCNLTYKNKNYIVFNKKPSFNMILGYLIIIWYKLNFFLVEDNDKNLNSGKSKAHNTYKNFELVEAGNEKPRDGFEQIDITEQENAFIRNAVFDFLYLKKEHYQHVSVHKCPTKNMYLLLGKNHAMLANFN